MSLIIIGSAIAASTAFSSLVYVHMRKRVKRSVQQRVQQLRDLMRREGVAYYWVPAADQHFNEYAIPHWQRRQFISGFTGSAGDVLIGLEQAWLWTDSRYWLQADEQLDSSVFTLQRAGAEQVPALHDFLSSLLQAGAQVMVDAAVVTVSTYQRLHQGLSTSATELSCSEGNLIDEIWRQDRVSMPSYAVARHPDAFAGATFADKLVALRSALQQRTCDYLLVTDLTLLAWLFNLRGQAVETTPLLVAYAIVGHDTVQLFTDVELTSEILDYLTENAAVVRPYDEFQRALARLTGPVWLDPDRTSVATLSALDQADEAYYEASPLILPRACKNDAEQEGMRVAHRHDGLALVRFFSWLERDEHWRGLTEVTFAQKLLSYRQCSEYFSTVSFATICGYGDHGAVVHYQATEESAYSIADDSCLLLDSGGQYTCGGTTDVTRVLHFGTPTAQQKQYYTLVLKGHIAISRAQFTSGTCGADLDHLARSPLQQHGLDYGHATGHGVGSYLSVHEGPQGISPHSRVPLMPGMILSNEPGVYVAGEFGIRIENVVLVVNTGAEQYAFETLTHVPYEPKLIDVSLLDAGELDWLNTYHQQLRSVLMPDLNAVEQAWLRQKTAVLEK